MPLVDLVARGVAGKFNSEQERIDALEKLFQRKVDPVDRIDTMVIALGSSMFGITLIFMVIAWFKRRYRPIRAKNLPLTTCLFFSGVLWFLGDIPVNGHVKLRGGWAICKLWNIWMRVLFCLVFVTALFSRCYALERVFNQRRPTRGWGYYGPCICLFVFTIIYSIVTQAMPGKLTMEYLGDYELCKTNKGYTIVTVILLWIIWAVVAVMTYRLRNIQSTFNELREFFLICCYGTAALIKTTVVHFVEPKYPYVRGYRVAETLSDAFVINGIVLLILAYPVTMSIVRSKEYEREWLLRLRTDGMQEMYRVNMNLHSDPSKHYSRMEKSMFNRIPKDTAGDRANNGHGNGDDDRYSDMRNLGHESDTSNAEVIVEMSPGYLNSSDLPHSPRGNIISGGINDGSNMRHFDSQSVDSMDTIDNSVAKTRRIL